jgi:hypothetical protein
VVGGCFDTKEAEKICKTTASQCLSSLRLALSRCAYMRTIEIGNCSAANEEETCGLGRMQIPPAGMSTGSRLPLLALIVAVRIPSSFSRLAEGPSAEIGEWSLGVRNWRLSGPQVPPRSGVRQIK